MKTIRKNVSIYTYYFHICLDLSYIILYFFLLYFSGLFIFSDYAIVRKFYCIAAYALLSFLLFSVSRNVRQNQILVV